MPQSTLKLVPFVWPTGARKPSAVDE
jgi:hypothetical protein